MAKYININYPFKDSPKGFFLDLNADDASAIKADLMHLILTRKGQRLYNPDFGTSLLEYIYEPYDGLTFNDVKNEIETSVKKYLPQVRLNDLAVEPSPLKESLEGDAKLARGDAPRYAILCYLHYTQTGICTVCCI